MRDVLEHFDGPDDSPVIEHRPGLECQVTPIAVDVVEPAFSLVAVAGEFGLLVPAVIARSFVQHAIQHQIGHARPRVVIKPAPVISRTDNIASGDAGQQLAGCIPHHDLMLGIEHKGRKTQSIQYAKRNFHLKDP